MGLSRRLRNIALSQIKAIKDRLDRVDAEEQEAADIVTDRRSEADATRELNDPADVRLVRRTPEEIAAGTIPARQGAPASSRATTATAPANPLAVHYRVLGVEEGADLSTIEAAYNQLASRCAPERFPEGSEEHATAVQIRRRVESAYNALRDELDPTAGRFDKLEL